MAKRTLTPTRDGRRVCNVNGNWLFPFGSCCRREDRTPCPNGRTHLGAMTEATAQERSPAMSAPPLRLLTAAPPQLFFTGKGGVGKTSLACATAIVLADARKRVLLVSTDPASNLDEMFGQPLIDTPRPIQGVPGLSAMNIDPEAAAEAYRARVLAQLGSDTTEAERATVREQ